MTDLYLNTSPEFSSQSSRLLGWVGRAASLVVFAVFTVVAFFAPTHLVQWWMRILFLGSGVALVGVVETSIYCCMRVHRYQATFLHDETCWRLAVPGFTPAHAGQPATGVDLRPMAIRRDHPIAEPIELRSYYFIERDPDLQQIQLLKRDRQLIVIRELLALGEEWFLTRSPPPTRLDIVKHLTTYFHYNVPMFPSDLAARVAQPEGQALLARSSRASILMDTACVIEWNCLIRLSVVQGQAFSQVLDDKRRVLTLAHRLLRAFYRRRQSHALSTLGAVGAIMGFTLAVVAIARVSRLILDLYE